MWNQWCEPSLLYTINNFLKKMLPFALQITVEQLQHFLEHYQNGEIRINKHNEKYMVLFQKWHPLTKFQNSGAFIGSL